MHYKKNYDGFYYQFLNSKDSTMLMMYDLIMIVINKLIK